MLAPLSTEREAAAVVAGREGDADDEAGAGDAAGEERREFELLACDCSSVTARAAGDSDVR